MTRRTPPAITQLAETYGLGVLLETHRSSSEMVLLLVMLGVIGIVCCLAAIAARQGLLAGLIAIAVGGLFYLAIACNCLYRYDQGLIHVSPWRRYVTRYDQIDNVWQQATKILDSQLQHRSTEYLYTIQDQRGKRLMLRLPKVGHWVQTQVLHCKMPQIRADYRVGNPIWFHRIAVTQDGLLKKPPLGQPRNTDCLPWAAVNSVKVEGGMVTIWTTDAQPKRWLQLAIADMPNFPIFTTLVEAACGVEYGGDFVSLSPWNQLRQLFTGVLQ